MRQELRHYYPDVPEDRIIVVGTPQFDPYQDSSLLWSREEFFRRIGADPSRKLICYSGGDCSIYPGEEQFVRILLELIGNEEIKGRPQVILRPCPVDMGSRFDAVRAAHPELIYGAPEWLHPEPGNWASSLPKRADVQFLANLTHHADVNVNLASTMTLDYRDPRQTGGERRIRSGPAAAAGNPALGICTTGSSTTGRSPSSAPRGSLDRARTWRAR